MGDYLIRYIEILIQNKNFSFEKLFSYSDLELTLEKNRTVYDIFKNEFKNTDFNNFIWVTRVEFEMNSTIPSTQFVLYFNSIMDKVDFYEIAEKLKMTLEDRRVVSNFTVTRPYNVYLHMGDIVCDVKFELSKMYGPKSQWFFYNGEVYHAVFVFDLFREAFRCTFGLPLQNNLFDYVNFSNDVKLTIRFLDGKEYEYSFNDVLQSSYDEKDNILCPMTNILSR